MKFQPNPERNSVKIAFIEGSLTRFDGKKLFIGYGEKKAGSRIGPLTRRKFVILMRKVIATAKQNKLSSIAVDFKDLRSLAPKDFSDTEVGKITATAFVMANYEHNTYKTKPKEGFAEVKVVAVPHTPEAAKGEGFWIGEQIGAEVNACRELDNTPGGDMTPKILAAAAKKALKGTKAKVKVLGRKEMQRLGMGAVLGIAKGSIEEPQFIVMEYWGAGKRLGSLTPKGELNSHRPIVLIGKGVTFDTGGLQIKSGDYMYEMHMDMSGGAAVIYAIALAAKLKIQANVVGLIPAVENNPGNSAVRPGDILKSLSGKTIEILHTDAEGRVILADAITYAKRYSPKAVVDVATLTGAALTALGVQASAVMSNDADFEKTVRELGEISGDYVWPMPLWEEYDDMVKGNFGDVPNISTAGNSRYGGVIAGGKFLEVFAKELNCPWVHLDIAPKMTAAPGEHLAKGAAGAPVRLLFALIEKHAK
ncbi:MAG: leucyl aminopeptidase [bacterium]|nr:leucyl aminopeptidase [bacterium]